MGYCIGHDQYFKQDDVGIIYQMNVVPERRRALIGATLVKAMFERAAYGCRLFCCWCAQDIEANYFWESLGFVPLAFRTGSRGKKRIHIFWERRVREGDLETPYWFPCQTGAGAIREDRLVFPIPPGVHWSAAKPVILPESPRVESDCAAEGARLLCNSTPRETQKRERKEKKAERPAGKNMVSSHGLRIGPKQLAARGIQPPAEPVSHRARKPKAAKAKCDPRHVAMARELRDRYLEEVNGGRFLPEARGKYEVSRQLGPAQATLKELPLLKAA